MRVKDVDEQINEPESVADRLPSAVARATGLSWNMQALAGVVGALVIVRLIDAAGWSVPRLQSSRLPTDIVQYPDGVTEIHCSPPPPGSWSVRWTLVAAIPPILLTLIWKLT